MTERELDRARRTSCEELIRKLEGPLSFVGEAGSHYVMLDGKRQDLGGLIEGAKGSIDERDALASELSRRLQEIKEKLRTCSPDTREPKALYEEGVAIKRAIYLLSKRGREDIDPHEDLRRWLEYGRNFGR